MIEACLKFRAIFALDAIFHYDENRALIVFNATRWRRPPPMQRRRKIRGRAGLQFPAPTQRDAYHQARRGGEIRMLQTLNFRKLTPDCAANGGRPKNESQEDREAAATGPVWQRNLGPKRRA